MTGVLLDARAGAKPYSPALLAVYDWLVLVLNARMLWGCRAAEMLGLYDANVSSRHLDVGVGSGYFLDRCRFPSTHPSICLYDLNENSLAHTARRIARYRPVARQGNVLDALPYPAGSFDSVALSAVLHCLPGDLESKSVVFENVSRCLAVGGVLFGGTVVNVPERMHWLARRKLLDFNRRGFFSNLQDTPEALERSLAKYFDAVSVRMVGAVALFTARGRGEADVA